MALPFTFASLPTGNVPAADLDQNFAALGALTIIPCTASGTNTITLTPISNTPTVSGYVPFQQFAFFAAATSTGAVTVNVNGIGAIPLNVIGGAQAGSGQVQSGLLYVIALNSNATAALIVSAQISGAQVQRSFLAGMTLSNDIGTPLTLLDIAAGQATDSTNTVSISLSAITKSISGAWAAGSGANGMGTGVTFGPTGGVSGGPWFPVFAILNNGSSDVYFDNSLSAANKPANTTAFRRIGFIKSDGSSHIVLFFQTNDLFEWANPNTDDINNATQSTSGVNYVVNVPPGINVIANIQAEAGISSGAVVNARIYDPAQSDFASAGGTAAPSLGVTANSNASALRAQGSVWVRTDTSQHVRAIADSTLAVFALRAVAWYDYRGKDQ